MILRLSRTLERLLQSETKAAAPHECCGLLLGDRASLRIDAILPAANVADDPRHRFEIDPAVLLAAHKAARMGGAQIVGHYHSHPRGEPIPSAVDAAMAHEDGALWLLVGSDDRLTAWQAVAGGPVEGRFSPIGMSIEDESGLAPAGAPRH